MIINNSIIGESVHGFVLKEISYNETRSSRTQRDMAYIHVKFVHRETNALCRSVQYLPDPNAFASPDDYADAIYEAWIWLESIASAYISQSDMADLLNTVRDAQHWCSEFTKKAMTEGAFSELVTLKTLPDLRNRVVKLPRYPFFISSRRSKVKLQYSTYERELVEEYYKYLNMPIPINTKSPIGSQALNLIPWMPGGRKLPEANPSQYEQEAQPPVTFQAPIEQIHVNTEEISEDFDDFSNNFSFSNTFAPDMNIPPPPTQSPF